MSNEKTLIILTPGFPESESDTTCLPMQQSLVKALKELYPGMKIVVLTFQYPYHKNIYRWYDIKVIPFNGRNKGGWTKISLRQKILATLDQIHGKDKIVGLLSFWSNECAWIGKKFSDKYGLRHRCWILGQDAKKENKYPQQIRFRPEELVSLSDFLQDEFERNHGVRPQIVIPPGVDEKLFDHSRTDKDIDLLGAGSLIPLKQYDIFLEVVAELQKQIPSVKAVLIGKGPEKEKLELLIANSNLKDNVTLTGELSYPEVLQYMQRSRVFLHPSAYEGFGCVCLEALYARAHVISFCQPMKRKNKNWHIAKKKEEMVLMASEILKERRPKNEIQEYYSIIDTARAMMKLFDPG